MGGTKFKQETNLYDTVAQKSSAVIINQYSTSFGLATNLLTKTIQRHIKNIYALVRLADEIVDGSAASANILKTDIKKLLDALEQETLTAVNCGYSTNLVVHSFAITARTAGITENLISPFFASMRVDIDRKLHTEQSLASYIYGSAEVIGLMCLEIFLLDQVRSKQQKQILHNGAKHLGAAFQKINFLRDISADFDFLGRSYFPNISLDSFNETDKKRLLTDIFTDLQFAAQSLPLLPTSSRRGVTLAYLLFKNLAQRIAQTPATVLKTTRIRVPSTKKIVIATQAASGFYPKDRF